MKKWLSTLLFVCALPAQADRLPLPSDTPASFREECGSCHLAFPPALLSAPDWRRLMLSLDRHFGSDATVDQKTGAEISTFLERHAGKMAPVSQAKGALPRISQTARFIRKHKDIPARFWRDPRVKSVANCEACHANAASGSYSEHDIAIPELRE